MRCACAGSQQALQPVEALLAVAAHPDDDLAAMSFNFWHRLARHLTSSFSAEAPVRVCDPPTAMHVLLNLSLNIPSNCATIV